MNLGNNKLRPTKAKSGGVEGFVEKLNKIFGRLLGKKDNLPPPQPHQTSNTTFSIIILLCCLLLWFCTGFYFLGENEYGLILTNGKVVAVKRGIRVGFSLPYPFGNVEIIDATPIKAVTIGDTSVNSFTVLDKNLLPVLVNARFSYQISDPKVLYQNHLQDQDAFDTEILWLVESKIRDAISLKSSLELESANLTVLSNEISGKLNTILASYGIILDKFTIMNIGEPDIAFGSESRVVASLKQVQQLKELVVGRTGERVDNNGRSFTREVVRDRSKALD
ncbi:MAG: hypothetical protein K0R14_414 [Burkholderiales bacterium]|jgi:hypothetical protein|nr:hypothetical protein [Burkholderiales bacterium]